MFEAPSRAQASVLARPELPLPPLPTWYEQLLHRLQGGGRRWWAGWQGERQLRGVLQAIRAQDAELAGLAQPLLDERLAQLRGQLLVKGYNLQRQIDAFALIREFSGRVLGMRHFDSQLTGGWHLMRGCIAEMATGEGKTLTATLPAAAAALAGIPVHVVTVNEYLSSRDCDEMRPLYQALGLSVGCIEAAMTPTQRRQVYACDIVYCTNHELVFDYLKDYLLIRDTPEPAQRYSERLKGSDRLDQELMLRGLHFAIIDEADSVCMDEARTPLIISAESPGHSAEQQMYEEALAIASQLQAPADYSRFERVKAVELTEAGERRVDRLCAGLGPCWVGRVRRYELVRQALTANLYFQRDRHYLVRDDKIQIIDEHTGRVMADRSWQRGLHQMLEVKEGCAITSGRETLAKVSYQRFFRRYRFFAGMTGTAHEVQGEFWDIYGKQVVKVKTHHPLRRRRCRDRLFASRPQQLAAIADSARRQWQAGRAVLVGTTTVGASEQVAAALQAQGLPVQLLNAKQDHLEAEIIAQAGQPGRITIATSMAGRGTDIKLHPSVEQQGGLHVILCALQEAGRIDRQLEGRCARFGDPGSIELMVSLDDEWLESAVCRPWLARVCGSAWGEALGLWLMRRAQRRLERRHQRMRYQLLKADEQRGETLSFTRGSL